VNLVGSVYCYNGLYYSFPSFWACRWGFFLQHPNPIGSGLAMEAIVEAAGPECIVPGQITPIKLLGVKVLLFHQKDGLI
jgi:hypothetical protein